MRRTLPAGQRVFAAGTPSLTQTPGPSASLCYVSLLPSPQKPWDAPGSAPQLPLILAHFSLSSTVQGSRGNSEEMALGVFRVLELRMTDDPSYYFNIIMN